MQGWARQDIAFHLRGTQDASVRVRSTAEWPHECPVSDRPMNRIPAHDGAVVKRLSTAESTLA